MRALTQAGELILGSRATDGRLVVQMVQSRLRLLLGEYVLSPTSGWLNVDDYKHNPDIYDIEARATKIILNTTGVLSLISMDSLMEDRILTITFKANTTFGVIDLSVPWS